MKICLAGEGAMGVNHLKALRQIDGVEVASLCGGIAADTEALAREWDIPHWSLDLEECLDRPGIEAVILATPSPLHAAQAEFALGMDKHVLVEIPMAMSVADSRRLAALEQSSGKVCMVAHTRRYNPPHAEIRRRILAGEFHLQHLVAETYFFRRTNTNMFGKPRGWVDNLLWHHACHTVDLAAWLLDDPDMAVWGQAGPVHPELGIPMDMTIGMRSRRGALVSLTLSFNNRGPFGTHFRYIGEEETFFAFQDTLRDHDGNVLPLAGEGFVLQDRAFVDAVREGRTPDSSVTRCLPAMEMLGRIQTILDAR